MKKTYLSTAVLLSALLSACGNQGAGQPAAPVFSGTLQGLSSASLAGRTIEEWEVDGNGVEQVLASAKIGAKGEFSLTLAPADKIGPYLERQWYSPAETGCSGALDVSAPDSKLYFDNSLRVGDQNGYLDLVSQQRSVQGTQYSLNYYGIVYADQNVSLKGTQTCVKTLSNGSTQVRTANYGLTLRKGWNVYSVAETGKIQDGKRIVSAAYTMGQVKAQNWTDANTLIALPLAPQPSDFIQGTIEGWSRGAAQVKAQMLTPSSTGVAVESSADISEDGQFELRLPSDSAVASVLDAPGFLRSSPDCTGAISASDPGVKGTQADFAAYQNGQQIAPLESGTLLSQSQTGASVELLQYLYFDRPATLDGSQTCTSKDSNGNAMFEMALSFHQVNVAKGWNVVKVKDDVTFATATQPQRESVTFTASQAAPSNWQEIPAPTPPAPMSSMSLKQSPSRLPLRFFGR